NTDKYWQWQKEQKSRNKPLQSAVEHTQLSIPKSLKGRRIFYSLRVRHVFCPAMKTLFVFYFLDYIGIEILERIDMLEVLRSYFKSKIAFDFYHQVYII